MLRRDTMARTDAEKYKLNCRHLTKKRPQQDCKGIHPVHASLSNNLSTDGSAAMRNEPREKERLFEVLSGPA